MSTKRTVKLDPDLYERVKAQKRDDETFSETIERLIGEVSLLDLSDGGEPNPERAAEMKEALDRGAQKDSEEAAKMARRLSESDDP
jgi:predicted CopG family antitoxin